MTRTVSASLPDDLEKIFNDFRERRGLNTSEALKLILKEHLNDEKEVKKVELGEETREKLKLLVSELSKRVKERDNAKRLFKCSNCGFTTDDADKFVNHKIGSFWEFLKPKLEEIKNKPAVKLSDSCIGGLCKVLDERYERKREEKEKSSWLGL